MTSAQQALDPARPIGRLGNPQQDRLAILLFLLVSAAFLFVDPKVPPIALQDEARNAINAVEMYLRGFSLVTTFNFQPDLWNTKPPLLIWLMSASMTLFGPSEWAIRLPSALAAMGILSCTLLFVRKVTGSLPLALGAAAIMLVSPGFFGEHGARTGDFDALLTFFVTAGLQILFFTLHRARPEVRSMIAIGALVGAGAMTKSIAAFIPVAGALPYLAATGRLKRTLSLSHRYSVAAGLAVGPLLIFYLAREAVGPGYLATVLFNDIAGRFSETLIKPTAPWYYLKELSFGWIVAGPFLVATPFALAECTGRTRLLFIYAASIAGTSLLVFSAASNRAVQYALPMFPWLSIMGVLTLRYLLRFVRDALREGKKAQAVVLGLALLLAGGQMPNRAAEWRFQRFPERQFYAQSSYGDLFGEVSARGVSKLTVVDPGKIHLGKPGYTPLLRWNRLIWRERGMAIDHLYQQPSSSTLPLASCEPLVFERWTGAAAEKVGSCVVLWSTGARGSPD